MSNLYSAGRQKFLTGSLNWTNPSTNFKIVLVSDMYSFDDLHENIDDVTGIIATSGNLANKTAVNGIADADDVVFEGVSLPTPSVATVSSRSRTDGVATLVTVGAHNLYVGTEITVAGVESTFNGSYVVSDVLTPTSFEYVVSGDNVSSTLSSGTVSSGFDIKYIIVYHDTGTPSTSTLIAYYDSDTSGDLIDVTPTGSAVGVYWSNSLLKMFRL